MSRKRNGSSRLLLRIQIQTMPDTSPSSPFPTLVMLYLMLEIRFLAFLTKQIRPLKSSHNLNYWDTLSCPPLLIIDTYILFLFSPSYAPGKREQLILAALGCARRFFTPILIKICTNKTIEKFSFFCSWFPVKLFKFFV